MANSETISPGADQRKNTDRPGAKTRVEALEYIRSLRESAGRVVGEEATKVAFISGPDGVVMTSHDRKEDIRRRREHGGLTPEDKDYVD